MENPKVTSVGLFSKPGSQLAAELVPQVLAWLRERGVTVHMDLETAGYSGHPDQGRSRELTVADAEVLIVLGGDGTLLSVARAAVGRELPLLAVNLGALGFLTTIKVEDLYKGLEIAISGDYVIGRRRMLRTELWRDGALLRAHHALNDAVLTKLEIARMIDLEVHVDESFVCVYRADGLIVATPTGSTAYSLSAGGPIMIPGVGALAITPISPHMLTNRPVIVPDESEISVRVQGAAPTYMTIDGQVGEKLMPDDRVVCTRSEHNVNLIQLPETRFFDVLREKLKWGGH